MKQIYFLLGLVLVMCCLQNTSYAQAPTAASASWPLTSATTVNVTTSGEIAATNQQLANMEINNYVTNGQRTQITGGSWPGSANYDLNRYIQFQVSPKAGTTLDMNSIAFAISSAGGGNMRARVFYSTDPTFATENATPILYNGNAVYVLSTTIFNVSATTDVTLNPDQSLYVRIYPWYTSTSTGKYLLLKDVVISGQTTPAATETAPVVITNATINDVNLTSATVSGEVTSDGGATLTARGIVYGTTENPTIDGEKTEAGTNTGEFSSELTPLTPGTTYFARAYATNSEGTTYGDQVSFTTLSSLTVPAVTTAPVSGVSYVTALSGGDVTLTGGADVTARGIVWNTTGAPTPADNSTEDGSGTGGFTSELTGLTPGTTYFVRAYATNSEGTAYGQEVSFTTASLTVPAITTAAVSNVMIESAQSGGNVTDTGGMAVTARGIVWNTSGAPTTADNQTEDGTSAGAFTSQLTGLTANTTYYVRAYAINSMGTAYGEEISFTTEAVTAPATATWPLTTATTESAITAGNISATKLGGTMVFHSTGNPDNSRRYNIVGNSWPAGQTDIIPGTYLQFSVAPESGHILDVNSIAFEIAAAGGSNMFAKAYYSTDSNFSFLTDAEITNGTRITNLQSTALPQSFVAVTQNVNNVKLNQNQSLYVRIYPWYGQSSTSKYIALRNIVVSGVTSEAPAPPVVTTASPATNVLYTSATVSGNVTSEGEAPVTVRGVAYGTAENPTTAGGKTEAGSGPGTFSSELTGLTPATTYYARAYATNEGGTSYGEQVSFTTLAQKPAVTTAEVSDVTAISAKSGGNVTETGAADVIARGIVWNITENPTIADQIGITDEGSGAGEYISELTGLAPGATYFIRAYATNEFGTSYGTQISFTSPVTRPTVVTGEVSEVTAETAEGGGNVTETGGAEVTARGIVWNTTGWLGTEGEATLADNIIAAGEGTGEFNSQLSGLMPGTTYFVRAYATNSAGTAYGDEEGFTTLAPTEPTVTTTAISSVKAETAESGGIISLTGGAEVTARGVVWSSTEELPTLALNDGFSDDEDEDGSFTSQLTGLTASTTYYVRAYATNGVGTAYGDVVSFTTLAPFAVTTTTVSNVMGETATAGGDVISDGGSPVTARGVAYGTTESPTIDGAITVNGTGTGSFSSPLTGLSPNTAYFVRAYATNSEGTVYGEQVSFITLATGSAIWPLTNPGIGGSGQEAVIAGEVMAQNEQLVNMTIVSYSGTDGSQRSTRTNGWLASRTDIYTDTYIQFEVTPEPGKVLDVNAISFRIGAGGTSNMRARAYYSTDPNFVIASATQFTGLGPSVGLSTTSLLAVSATPSITLNEGQSLYVRVYSWLHNTTSISGTREMALKDIVISGVTKTLPAVATIPAPAITYNSATVSGNVTSEGDAPVTVRGVAYGTTENPTTAGTITEEGAGLGEFSSELTGLTPGTMYYARAYATSSLGIVYGQQVSFFTESELPTVTTAEVKEADITTSTAIVGGEVTKSGLSEVTGRGVVYAATENPTIEDNGGITTDGDGLGEFSSQITGLTPGTQYFVRAYATNSTGTFYGEQESFTTLAELPAVTTSEAENVRAVTATVAGAIIADGGASITARGMVWNATGSPDIANEEDFILVSDSTGTGIFISQLEGLIPDTEYFVRAYATNSVGTAYGEVISFTTMRLTVPTVTTADVTDVMVETAVSGGNVIEAGGTPVLVRGVVWNNIGDPTIEDNKTEEDDEEGSFTSQLTGLTASTSYYVRAYATNGVGTAYGDVIEFTTLAPFAVTTAAVTGVTPESAVTGGNVTSDGGYAVTARGIVWNTTGIPDLNNDGDFVLISDDSGTGIFISQLQGLTSLTTYYVRAYATNSTGTVYGDVVEFATLAPTVPVVTTAAVSNVKDITAVSGGNVSQAGGAEVIARGVVWSTSANPTIADNVTVDGDGTGSFNSQLQGMSAKTTYYVRAYATNSVGTAYGDAISFTTETFITAASATWPLTSTIGEAATTTGQIIAPDRHLQNMQHVNWVTNGNRTQITGGNWPARTDFMENTYIQFQVAPTSGNVLDVNSIAFDISSAGGSHMKAKVFYSTDPDFNIANATPILYNGQALLELSTSTVYNIFATTDVTLNDGQVLNVRVYPWYSQAADGKYVVLKDMVINGEAPTPPAFEFSATVLELFKIEEQSLASKVQSYTMSGLYFTEAVRVTAPFPFYVSLREDRDFVSVLDIAPDEDGSLTSKTIFVKYYAIPGSAAEDTNSGNITHTTAGVTPMNVAVEGEVVPQGALPVELVSFTYVQQQDGVLLEWKTASEKDNSHFEIEMANDLKSGFERIGKVDSKVINSSTLTKYQYKHNYSTGGTRYYRLKQVDLDGTFEYSNVIAVETVAAQEVETVKVAPNPINYNSKVFFKTLSEGKAVLRLSSLEGKQVYTKEASVRKGENEIQLPVYDLLSKGVYILTVELNGNLHKVKMLKQ